MVAKHYDVIVVGGGISGLSAAAFLAEEGVKVCLVEKEKNLGGYLSFFKRKETFYDAAVHTFYGKNLMISLLRHFLGIDIRECLKDTPWNGRLVYPDREIFLAQNQPVEKVFSFVTGSDNNKLSELFVRAGNFCKNVELANLDYQLHAQKSATIEDFVGWVEKEYLERVKRVMCENGYNENFSLFLQKYDFERPEIREVLLSFPPTPATVTAAHLFGWCYGIREKLCRVEGGTRFLVETLERKILEKGGKIFKEVEVIEYKGQNNCVTGVLCEDGNHISGKVVISTISPKKVFREFLSSFCVPISLREKILNGKPYLSDFILYIKLKKDFEEKYKDWYYYPVYVYPRAKIEKVYADIENGQFVDDPLIMFYIEKVDDETILYVHQTMNISFFNGIEGKTYKAIKEKIMQQMLMKLRTIIKEIDDYIMDYYSASPLTLYRYTYNEEGSIIGWYENQEQLLPLLPVYVPDLKNLIFAGHWTLPGKGIPVSFFSGYISALLAKKVLG